MHTDSTLALLAAAKTKLEARGLQLAMTEQQTLCGDLVINGDVYAKLHILAAEAYFTDIAALDEAEAFEDYIYGPVKDLKPSGKQPAYVLVVGEREFIYSQAFAHILSDLEFSTSIAKKYVCTLDDIETWAVNPFEAWPVRGEHPNLTLYTDSHGCFGDRSNPAERFVDALAEQNFRKESFISPPAGPDVFCYEGLHDTPALLDQLAKHPDLPRAQLLIETLFRRIIGTEFSLKWDDEGNPRLMRAGRGDLPFFCWGNGEQMVFSLCLFLALAYGQGAGQCTLVLSASMKLDTLRRLGVLDCLRDFVHATGADIWAHCSREKAPMFNLRVGDAVARVRAG